MQFHEKLVSSLFKNRITIFVLIAMTTLFFGYAVTTLEVDNDPSHSLPDNLQQKVDIKTIREKFNTPYSMLFMAELTEGTLNEKLQLLDTWQKELSAISVDDKAGTPQPGFENVLSLSSLKVPMKGGMLGVTSKPLLKEGLSEEKLQQRINENRELTSMLISEDQTIFLMILYSNEKIDRQIAIGKAVEVVEGFHEAGYTKTYITGATATAWFLNDGMRRDFARLLPVAVLLSMIILFLIFRRISFVFSPLIIIAIALIWSFGLMALVGYKFSVLTGVIPLILFPVGLADSIHVLKCYENHRREGKDHRTSFVFSFEELLRPILLTSVTTFFGFASFAFSSLEWTQAFGIFTGLAVMLALLMTVLLLPLFIPEKVYSEKEIHKKEISIMPMKAMETFIFKTPGAAIFLALVLAFSLYYLPKLGYENNPISFFNEDHDIVMTDSIIGQEFGGSRFFDILIESDSLVNDSLRWSEISDIVETIERNPNVGRVTSLLTVINRLSSLQKNQDIASSTLTMLFNENSFFGKAFGPMVNAGLTKDRKAVKLSLTCKNVPQFNYITLADEIIEDVQTKYPHYKVTAAGQALMIDAGVELVTKTQINSLTLTFITVALILMILYRDVRVGLFTTFPIIVATIFIAALMAAMGVTINSITVIIMNSSVGIGIDYAIHFTAGFLRAREHHESTKDAILHAIHDKGTVIVFNTIAVGVGFLVLNVSGFPPVRDLGLFIFLSMTVSSLFSLLFLPLLLQWIKPLKK